MRSPARRSTWTAVSASWASRPGIEARTRGRVERRSIAVSKIISDVDGTLFSGDAIIDRRGLNREEAIGDREIDVLAGRSARVRTCSFGPRPAATVADLVVDDFSDLAGLRLAER